MNDDEHHEGGFYKGLFYGVVLGLGLVWFMGTKEGKKVKEEIFKRGEELLGQIDNSDKNSSDEDEVDLPKELPG